MTAARLHLRCWAVLLATLLTWQPAAAQSPDPIAQLYRLDELPRLRPNVTVGMVSSYDRSGGNDDGFNGTYSFVRREAEGLVIADLTGPGVVTRIWTPTPTDDIVEFYFDGERSPRIRARFRDLFSGTAAPFNAPLVAIGAGGFTSYAPIPYARSLKVVVRSQRVEFYQLNFATFGRGTRIRSYAAGDPAYARLFADASRLAAMRPGSDLSTLAAGAAVERQPFGASLAPGLPVSIYENDTGGRIVGLRLGPTAALQGPTRDIRLRVTYDGAAAPAIDAPVGDLFGYAWGQEASRGLLAGTDGETNYLHLPMPYDRSVRVELVSDRTGGPPIALTGEIAVAAVPRRPDEGRLYALWRRENPTREGVPYTFLDADGRGHLVGLILQAQGPEPGGVPEFFEGDDVTTIDGRMAIHGTGSEDLFNGGWYDVPGRWDGRVSLPFSGSLAFDRHIARTGGYRFMVADAYPWRRSIRQTIEHGPQGDRFVTDYVSVAYFYAANPPALPALPPVAERRISDPTTVVFTPGWSAPIHSFSWSNATLSKQDVAVGERRIRHLSLDARDREVFGPHYISFLAEMPAAGRYRVRLQAIAGPDQGIVQLFREETPRGEAADLYAPALRLTAELELGVLDLLAGDNRVMLKVVGRNPASSGNGLDIYRLVFERVP